MIEFVIFFPEGDYEKYHSDVHGGVINGLIIDLEELDGDQLHPFFHVFVSGSKRSVSYRDEIE